MRWILLFFINYWIFFFQTASIYHLKITQFIINNNIQLQQMIFRQENLRIQFRNLVEKIRSKQFVKTNLIKKIRYLLKIHKSQNLGFVIDSLLKRKNVSQNPSKTKSQGLNASRLSFQYQLQYLNSLIVKNMQLPEQEKLQVLNCVQMIKKDLLQNQDKQVCETKYHQLLKNPSYEKLISKFDKPVCIGCCKLFKEGKPIPQTKQKYRFLSVNLIKMVFKDSVQKIICALLNSLGGFLLIGSSYYNNQLFGCNYESLQNVKEFVLKIIEGIFPKFNMEMNFVETDNMSNKILKVTLKPSGQNTFYFVKKQIQNFPQKCNTYFFKPNEKSPDDGIYQLKYPESIYPLFQMKKYINQKRKQIQIVHKFDCVEESDLFQEIVSNINSRPSGLKVQFVKKDNQEPILKYCHQSVIIFTRKKYLNEQNQIRRFLDQSNIEFENHLIPHQFCLTNTNKSYWYFDHKCGYKKFRDALNQNEKNRQHKKNRTILACHRYLEIQLTSNKNFNKKIEDIIKYNIIEFNKYFKFDSVTYLAKMKEEEYFNFIEFKNNLDCLFLFLSLDNFGIKSKIISLQNSLKYSNKEQVYTFQS